jgi:hypothetical protein
MLDVPNSSPAASVAIEDIRIRAAIFGDWLECGDMSRIIRCVPPGAEREEAIEFRANEAAIAAWMVRLTGLTAKQIGGLPIAVGRAIYQAIAAAVPAFAYAKPEDALGAKVQLGAVELTLTRPIAGHREEHQRILFRPPTFGDVIMCGDIVSTRVVKTVAINPEIPSIEEVISPESVGRWFAALSGLPLPVLMQLSYLDALAAFALLRPLILEVSHENFGEPLSNFGSAAAQRQGI